MKLKSDNSLHDSLDSTSSIWVGAWWPGFLITCGGGFLCGLVMFCFPRTLQERDENEETTSADSGFINEIIRKISKGKAF